MFHKESKELQDALAQQEARIGELEAALESRKADLAAKDGELALLKEQAEKALAARDAALESFRQESEKALAARDAEAASLRQEGEALLGLYRALLLAGAPEAPPELVTGTTAAEVEASLAQAKSLARRVQEQLAQAGRIPAGAPVRQAPDLSALSPKEKIAWGLGRR